MGWQGGERYLGINGILIMKAKLVRESIRFERGLDPLTSMGVGDPYAQAIKRMQALADSEGLEFIEGPREILRINLPVVDYSKDNTYNSTGQWNYKKGKFDVDMIQYRVNWPKGWEDSPTPISLRKGWMFQGKGQDQSLMDRLPNMEEAIRRIKASIVKERKKAGLAEGVNFERGQDPKKAMGIGIQPFDWDEILDAWDTSNLGNLTGGGGGHQGDMDSLIEVDDSDFPSDLPDEKEQALYDNPVKLRIYGNIDHPMSGYGGSYNEADVDLTAEKLPDGKIRVHGTVTKEYGSIEKEDEDDDYGERIFGSKDKPHKTDWIADDLDDMMSGLEEMPQ